MMKKLPVINNEAPEKIEFESLKDRTRPIYMDNNATTEIDTDALDAMIRALEVEYANPSAVHAAGRIVKERIELARQYVSIFMGCGANEFIFTSSGTESINAVISSVVKANTGRNHIITCATEHNATLNALKSLDNSILVSYLEVDRYGSFSLSELDKLLQGHAGSNLLFTIMAANNETGSIHQYLFDAIDLAKKHNTLIHIDAVQVAGKLPLYPYIDSGIDYMSISGHKFHAPKGIGALYIKPGAPFSPTFFGGSQEFGLRAGTENVPGMVGMGVVAKSMPMYEKMAQLYDLFLALLRDKVPSCIVNNAELLKNQLMGTINVGFKYVHREAMVVKMSEYDLYASIGSACAAGIEPSHVLKAMKVPQEYIHGSVRFSFSKYTTENEIRRAVDIIEKAYNELRAISVGIVA
jgi:cysteine desulfurase